MPVVSHHQPQPATTTTTTTTPAVATSTSSSLSSSSSSFASTPAPSTPSLEAPKSRSANLSESFKGSPDVPASSPVISPVSSSSSTSSTHPRNSAVGDEKKSLPRTDPGSQIETEKPYGSVPDQKLSSSSSSSSVPSGVSSPPGHPPVVPSSSQDISTATSVFRTNASDSPARSVVEPTVIGGQPWHSSGGSLTKQTQTFRPPPPPQPPLAGCGEDFKNLLDSIRVVYPNRTTGQFWNANCSAKSPHSTDHTHPVIVIESINGSDSAQPQLILWQGRPDPKSLVYRYSVPIRVKFFWPSHSDSGFLLDFNFFKEQDVECSLTCNSHLCLRSEQLCDGIADCPGQADENNTACGLRQEAGSGETLKIAIVLSVVLFLALVALIILMIRHSRRQNAVRLSGDALLQPSQNQRSEACGSGSGSLQDSNDPQVALLQGRHNHLPEHHHQPQYQPHLQGQQQQYSPSPRTAVADHQMTTPPATTAGGGFQYAVDMSGRLTMGNGNAVGGGGLSMAQQYAQQQARQQDQHRLKPVVGVERRANTEMYPPHIPLSLDGEEGYTRAQQALHSKHQRQQNWLVEHEVFRPPPNKTIHERNSPPPPYSLISPGTKSLDSLVPPVGGWSAPQKGSQLSSPVVLRCHSMSCHRQPSILPGVHRGTPAVHSLPPPEYHRVVVPSEAQAGVRPSVPPGSTNTHSAQHHCSVGCASPVAGGSKRENSALSQAEAARPGIRTFGPSGQSSGLSLVTAGAPLMAAQSSQGHCVRVPSAILSSSPLSSVQSSTPMSLPLPPASSSSSFSCSMVSPTSCPGPQPSSSSSFSCPSTSSSTTTDCNGSASLDDKTSRRSSSWPQAVSSSSSCSASTHPFPSSQQPSACLQQVLVPTGATTTSSPSSSSSSPSSVVVSSSVMPVPTGVVSALAATSNAGLASPSRCALPSAISAGGVASQQAAAAAPPRGQPNCGSSDTSCFLRGEHSRQGWGSGSHEPCRNSDTRAKLAGEVSEAVPGQPRVEAAKANSEVLYRQSQSGPSSSSQPVDSKSVRNGSAVVVVQGSLLPVSEGRRMKEEISAVKAGGPSGTSQPVSGECRDASTGSKAPLQTKLSLPSSSLSSPLLLSSSLSSSSMGHQERGRGQQVVLSSPASAPGHGDQPRQTGGMTRPQESLPTPSASSSTGGAHYTGHPTATMEGARANVHLGAIYNNNLSNNEGGHGRPPKVLSELPHPPPSPSSTPSSNGKPPS